MDKSVEEKVKEIIALTLCVDVGTILNTNTFQDDLKFDSLDMVEFNMQLEEEFGINIDDATFDKMTAKDNLTVQDVINYLLQKDGLK